MRYLAIAGAILLTTLVALFGYSRLAAQEPAALPTSDQSVAAGSGTTAPAAVPAAEPSVTAPVAQPPVPQPPTAADQAPEPSMPVAAAGAAPAADASGCLWPEQVEDRDGDFQRNKDQLSAPDLCIRQDIFNEGSLRWTLQIIQNRAKPYQILWVVPHDNENTAFDTAVYGVTKYGGTVVAVETGGARFNGRQDPNRNFNSGTNHRCPQQIAPSPEYTRRMLRWKPQGQNGIIIALHTNERGYAGDGRGGTGSISMAMPLAGNRPFRSHNPMPSGSSDDTIVFVASQQPKERDPHLSPLVDRLNAAGLNVMYESVSPSSNDCSLSHYAALHQFHNYFNLEVVHGDHETQRRMVDVLAKIAMSRDPAQPQPLPPAHTPAPSVEAEPSPTTSTTQRTTASAPSQVPAQPAAPELLRPDAAEVRAASDTSAEARATAGSPVRSSISQSPGKKVALQIHPAADQATAIKKKLEFDTNYSENSAERTTKVQRVNGTKYRVELGPFESIQDMREYCRAIKWPSACTPINLYH